MARGKTKALAVALLAMVLAVAVAVLAGVGAANSGHGKQKSASSAQYQYGGGTSAGKQYGLHRVQVCHKGHTITIAQPALKAHLNHGDTAGPCQPKPAAPTQPAAPTTQHGNSGSAPSHGNGNANGHHK
ncbi:MAG TPA: hypothetical protein VIU44_13545 [Gaiellaceae bacterium]